MEYKEQLLTDEWLSKKKKILKRDNYTCLHCKVTNCELHVHHIYYIKEHLAWQYPNKALITLCSKCHKKWHKTYELEIRGVSWKKRRDYIAPIKRGLKPWFNKSKKRKIRDKISLAMQQADIKRIRKKVNGIWIIKKRLR